MQGGGTANRVGTAALGCPAERSSATFHGLNPGRAALDRTAEGGCPHVVCRLKSFVEDLQLFGNDEDGFFLGQLKFLEFFLGHLDLD